MPTIDTGIDDHELKELIRDMGLGDKVMAFNAIQTLKAVSLAVERDVKTRMPVDTGRARASWGHGGMDEGDSVWEDAGASIKQGSNVEYIEYLNNGHSRQAPAGFIDRAQVRGEVALDLALGKIDITSPNAKSMTFSPSVVGYSEE